MNADPLREAVAQQQAGNLPQAEALCRRILSQNPGHAGALHVLSLIAMQVGNPQAALDLVGRAIQIDPTQADFHGTVGNIFSGARQWDDAINAYRRALVLHPRSAHLHTNLANALIGAGQTEDAVAAAQVATALDPNLSDAWYNLGVALEESGQIESAVDAYRATIKLRPDDISALNNLATILLRQGQRVQATELYRRALELNEASPQAWFNLGCALRDQEQFEPATAHFRQALALRPGFPHALNSLADILYRTRQFKEAADVFRQIADLNPQSPEAWFRLGQALRAERQFAAAVEYLRKAVELRPGFAEAINALAYCLLQSGGLDEAIELMSRSAADAPENAEFHRNLGLLYVQRAQLDEAFAEFRHSMRLRPDSPAALSSLLYHLHFHPGFDRKAILEEHLQFDRIHGQTCKRMSHANDRSPDRRLRIGYVSPNFRNHSVAHVTTSVLANHDHQNFEIFCYSDTDNPDQATQRIQGFADCWRTTAGISDQQLAELIHGDQIDILIDLTMHMSGSRLMAFARKPAPVQACWIAYPSTTGLSAMDYRISDPWLDPEDSDGFHVERTIRLPNCFWCYDPLDPDIGCNPLPAQEQGFITFGSLNSFLKLNDATLQTWARVLREVPDSRLLLLAPPGLARKWVVDRMEIDPRRIEFVDRQPRDRYLQTYHRIDIGLDTYPANGHTTSMDALWMGVPVVSLYGETAISRGGLSIAANLGMNELATDNREGFVQIAANLANDVPKLIELRETLRERLRASPLMDAPRFARDLEAAYRTMWRQMCES